MVIQKRKIETDQDRFGGFSSLNNNFSYFSNSTGTAEQQSIDEEQTGYIQTGEQLEEQEEYDAPTTYEGESEYTASDMVTEDEESEYAFVKTFMPNVERKSVVIETPKRTRVRQKAKLKLNARGKIFACMYSIVACLLVAFCIYNAVSISNIKNTLALKESEYAQSVSEVSVLQSNYDNLNSGSGLDQSVYNPISESNSIKFEIDKRPAFVEIEESTNWFDKVCKFLSRLF